MSRILALLYGAACYAVFLATFLYAIAFVTGVGVPKHVDSGPPTALPLALAIDLALLALFAIQHSGMARPRSEEHTSELQSLMRISYAVFCLKKKNTTQSQLIAQHTENIQMYQLQ